MKYDVRIVQGQQKLSRLLRIIIIKI